MGATEIRPGNFVFYDLMQQNIGACSIDDIALRVLCPVISKQSLRTKLLFMEVPYIFQKNSYETAMGKTSMGVLCYKMGTRKNFLTRQITFADDPRTWRYPMNHQFSEKLKLATLLK
jgi:hypothetical protein